MNGSKGSPARFILFLVVLAGLVSYVVVKWGTFQEETTAGTGFESSPVVLSGDETAEPSESGDDASGTAADSTGTAGETEATTEIRAVPDEAYFAESRAERERARSERIELLRGLVENPQVDAETRREAERELIEIGRRITQEAEIESLIQARGFSHVLVYLYDDASVVVVQADELTEAQAAQIADAVVKVADIPYAGISVMARPQ